jgi:hypothetical protein
MTPYQNVIQRKKKKQMENHQSIRIIMTSITYTNSNKYFPQAQNQESNKLDLINCCCLVFVLNGPPVPKKKKKKTNYHMKLL